MFHGNAMNYGDFLHSAEKYYRMNYNVLVVSYRGYVCLKHHLTLRIVAYLPPRKTGTEIRRGYHQRKVRLPQNSL